MSVKFGYIPLYSKLVLNEKELENSLRFYFDSLNSIGGKKFSKEEKSLPSQLFYFIITGGTENILIDHRNIFNRSDKNTSINLIAHPTHNSLPASLEVLAKYQQNNINGEIFYLDKKNIEKGLAKISNSFESRNTYNTLKIINIGLIGEPSDWLVASVPDKSIIKDVWGPNVIPINISELESEYDKLKDKDVDQSVNSVIGESMGMIEPKPEDVSKSIKVYLALKSLIEKYNLNAVTVRCFDLLSGINTSGCLALSMLNDEGTIAGCEGDLVSALGMVWIYNQVGEIPWMANPSQIDIEKNSIIFAHCTVPRNLVKNYKLRSHFESGTSIGISGEFEKTDITLVRIGGNDLRKIWVSEGKIINTGNSEHLCRTQVEIQLQDSSPEELLKQPLGNHILIVQGSHSKTLQSWWEKNIKFKEGI